VVFEPNYRGSDNMGNAFYAWIYKDAGAGPGRDVMSGVEMLQKRGFIDSSKMAVSGWSYGGYMTTWLLGHYDVWKAAVAGAAVTDWFVMYTTSDNSVTVRDQVGDSPYLDDNDKSWRDQSPITFAKTSRRPRSFSTTQATRAFRLQTRMSSSVPCSTTALRPSSLPIRFQATSPAIPSRGRRAQTLDRLAGAVPRNNRAGIRHEAEGCEAASRE